MTNVRGLSIGAMACACVATFGLAVAVSTTNAGASVGPASPPAPSQEHATGARMYDPEGKPSVYDGRYVSNAEVDDLYAKGLVTSLTYVADDSVAGGCIVLGSASGSATNQCPSE